MAVRLLERNGVKIVARNVVVERGEIDVIGQRGKMILFIEVKWRRSAARGNAAVAVTSLKRRRLLHAARVWLSANPGHADRLVRFDVVAIEEEPFQIEWIEGAFDASR